MFTAGAAPVDDIALPCRRAADGDGVKRGDEPTDVEGDVAAAGETTSGAVEAGALVAVGAAVPAGRRNGGGVEPPSEPAEEDDVLRLAAAANGVTRRNAGAREEGV
jgi:hypothetical protein